MPGLATDMDKYFNFSVGRSREALKRIHRGLDPFFVEGEMDFGVEVWRERSHKPGTTCTSPYKIPRPISVPYCFSP